MTRNILLLLILFVNSVSIFSQDKDMGKVTAIELNTVNDEKSDGNKLVDTPFLNRLGNGGINVRGNIDYVGNNILSIDDPNINFDTNADFNFGGNDNADFELGYIDIDDDLGIVGSNTTFSSSMSTLNLPSCSRVVFAGLYWAAIYPYDDWDDEVTDFTNNTRDDDFNTMKFKIPGQPYVDIVADKFDATARELIYDDGAQREKPYVCFKDVTNLIDINNPNGDYLGANIKATTGRDTDDGRLGSSAGWVLVIVYENETLSNKNVSIFDGFSTVTRDGGDTEVTFDGFTTIPPNPDGTEVPVRVRLLTAALEGDRPFTGDRFRIRNQGGNFQSISNAANPVNNFFNSSVTKDGVYVTDRAPASTNTLGFDIDMFELDNSGNNLVTNNQTSIDVQFTSNQDSYFPFITALTVEIIEPKIQLIKGIEDSAGNDIQGTPVGLGSELWYNIGFQSVGTDDATNTIITDRLPKNVDLLTTTAPNGAVAPDGTRFDVELPAGVTIVGYDPPSLANDFRGELQLAVDDSLVLEFGSVHNIRLHVQLVTDCNLLRDVCSNVIENQAFAR